MPKQGARESESASSHKDAAALDVVAGVDFGTSSTKVVVQVPNYTDSPAYAIPFGDLAHEDLEYLLPSRLFVGRDGRCSIAEPADLTEVSALTGIKVGLISMPQDKIKPAFGPSYDVSAVTAATAYLALVLKFVRCWFIEEKRNIFGDYDIIWSYNLGLPAAIDDDETLRETYDLVGNAAWLLSVGEESVTLDSVKMALDDAKPSVAKIEETLQEFQLIPEIVAEVMGYARSRHRRQGLHLFVDIGASTMDICSFILHDRDGDDNIAILTADVAFLGARQLHLTRISEVLTAMDVHRRNLLDQEYRSSRIPDDVASYIPEKQDTVEHLTRAEETFKKKCRKLVYGILAYSRRRGDPRSPHWVENFPVFLCGGGKSMKFYQQVPVLVEQWLQQFLSPGPEERERQRVSPVSLPKPASLEAETDDESYHRLAVAWGLSHFSFNIPEFRRPDEIGSVPRLPIVDYQDRYIEN